MLHGQYLGISIGDTRFKPRIFAGGRIDENRPKLHLRMSRHDTLDMTVGLDEIKDTWPVLWDERANIDIPNSFFLIISWRDVG